ncbi:DeoR/GlpR family DNA-binding transcription regulator, partial [uncultured Proteiniphilum sp.]|uniref:DeoR/GlpR family DNA-binding transcription regulator n=1 Tax=uncultured Proteiniphilum sp. TaxID=497637 RepID=UPI00262F1760
MKVKILHHESGDQAPLDTAHKNSILQVVGKFPATFFIFYFLRKSHNFAIDSIFLNLIIDMLKEERHKIIMKEINLHNKVLSVDLSAMLNVSEDTIRRDLKELAEEDRIIKVHGGAISKSLVRPFIADNNIYAHEEKKKIASKALSLIQNNMTLLFEGGTTILELASQLPKKINLTIFTVSPQVAITLSNFENINVYTIGGKLNKNANIHTGASVINDISNMKCDICFMGVNAVSIENGFTDIDWETVQV